MSQRNLPFPRDGIPEVSTQAIVAGFITTFNDSVLLISVEMIVLINGSCVTSNILLSLVYDRRKSNKFRGSVSGMRCSVSRRVTGGTFCRTA